jgi:hypothetical protein
MKHVQLPEFMYNPRVGSSAHFDPSGKRMRRALRCILLGNPQQTNVGGSKHHLVAIDRCLREIGWWSSNITHHLPHYYRVPQPRELDDVCQSSLAQAVSFAVAVLETCTKGNQKAVTKVLTPEVEQKLRPIIDEMKPCVEHLREVLRCG